MALRISLYSVERDELVQAALFTLVGKKLEINWAPNSEGLQEDLIDNGIATAKGIFYPKDGKSFYDNLELAFSNSTLIHVEEVSKFADTNFDYMAVYDKDGNDITPK